MPTSVRFCFFLKYVQNMQPNPPVKDSQHASSHRPPCKGIFFYGDCPNVWNHEVNPLALVVGLCLHNVRLKPPKCWSQVLLKPSGYGCRQNNFPPPDIFRFPKLNTVKCIRQTSCCVFGSKTTQGHLCEIILREYDLSSLARGQWFWLFFCSFSRISSSFLPFHNCEKVQFDLKLQSHPIFFFARGKRRKGFNSPA